MRLFDTDNDGHVDFDEFLVGIRVSKRFNLGTDTSRPSVAKPLS